MIPPEGGPLGRHGRFLAKPLMSPRGVVVADILEDDALKMPAVQHQDVVETLAPQRSEKALADGVHVRRFMKEQGLLRARKRSHREHPGGEPFSTRETRSYEVTHVHGLWHLDFHQGSRPVLTPSGQWQKPQLLGVLDDRSRLCCHLQWYLDETAEALIHGLSQAFHKRGLPRALLTDNGAAMIAAETVEGLERLGIVHHTTLPYSPEQNGKQESFWGQIEGRLLPMLAGEPHLTLDLLNTANQAWVEEEYQRKEHSEIRESPLTRYLRGPTVGRESPSSDALRRAFRTEVTRVQRRSDGTVTVEGVRFEVPSAYRTLLQLRLRVARWDLSSVDLVDPRSGDHLATLLPLDKARNAEMTWARSDGAASDLGKVRGGIGVVSTVVSPPGPLTWYLTRAVTHRRRPPRW